MNEAESSSRRAAEVDRRVAPRTLFMLAALLGPALFFSSYGALGGHELGFLTARNLSLLSIELASSGVLALGMLLVILPGHVDLAAGSTVGLTGAIAAMLVIDPGALLSHLLATEVSSQGGLGAPLSMLLALIASVLLYALMGAAVAYQRIPAFIVSLGGLLAFKGLHWKAIANATVPVAPGGSENALALLTTAYVPMRWAWPLFGMAFVVALLLSLSTLKKQSPPKRELSVLGWTVAAQVLLLILLLCQHYRGLPVAALLLVLVAVVVHGITEKTRLGRYLYAIGGNEQAARLAGIAVERVTLAAFVGMGIIAALSGFLQTSYAGSSTTTIGQLMELDAVAACVIGGASLRGGRGNAISVLFGALIMAVLLNGMTLMAVDPENKLIARGLILTLAVWIDLRLGRKAR